MTKVRRVRLSAAKPGDCLAKDVLSEDGRVLLSSGVRLTRTFLDLLAEHGVESVYLTGRPLQRAVREASRRVRRDLLVELREATRSVWGAPLVEAKGVQLPQVQLEVKGLRRGVLQVVREVSRHPAVALPLQELRRADEYTLMHSVEVCVIATLLGHALGLRGDSLVDLAMSALLHDVGKAGIPAHILNKPGPLTPDELTVMRQHPTLGWILLREHPDLPPETALVALQHHERWAGGGYPLGLQGEQIHYFARICAVADVYDALTADRVYREGIDPGEAQAMMTGPLRDAFDPHVLKAFLLAIGRAQEEAGTA